MEEFPKKQEETLGDIIKRLKKTSEAFQASHKLKGKDSDLKQKPKDQFKIIPPPQRSYVEMTQQKESDEPFRGIED